ncbi:MAG TPA: UDP-N-acetylglucosamine 2-epimerase [Candidatus Polarisedimenticolia bacterium]|nr:UDP-N-acetylglucosamine 2-epimerase [Candidatus Polarisedimenticolia bacterium]
MHFLHVVGARPIFMKAAPVMRALNDHRDVRLSLVHTGHRYDSNMSDVFCSQLDPEPDVNLDVGSGSHARQTAEIMSRIEAVLLERKPWLRPWCVQNC